MALLTAHPSTTVFETISIVRTHSKILLGAVQNQLPLSAGTDLFMRYLVTSLKQQTGSRSSHESFDAVRLHLVRNAREFAARASAARDSIAECGWRYAAEARTVLTHGASRAVSTLLARTARECGKGGVRFQVIYVGDDSRVGENKRVVMELRSKGIPVAVISESAVAHVIAIMNRVSMVLVGAEAVTSNGGIISRMGTLQIAKLASVAKPRIPFYVAAETHKFVRKMPMHQRDLGFKQEVVDFRLDEESAPAEDAVDFTVRVPLGISTTSTHCP